MVNDEIERGFQVLEIYGVPRLRARSVPNGIEVLVTRYRRLDDARVYEIVRHKEAIRKLLGLPDAGFCKLCRTEWKGKCEEVLEHHLTGCVAARMTL